MKPIYIHIKLSCATEGWPHQAVPPAEIMNRVVGSARSMVTQDVAVESTCTMDPTMREPGPELLPETEEREYKIEWQVIGFNAVGKPLKRSQTPFHSREHALERAKTYMIECDTVQIQTRLVSAWSAGVKVEPTRDEIMGQA
jgi:hypothetical protein